MRMKTLLLVALIAVVVAGCTTYPPNGTAITLTYPDGQTPGEEVIDDAFSDTESRGTGTTTVRGLRVLNDALVGNVLYGKSSMIFEGATDNTSETTLAITDPTADRTITFPNSSGTVALAAYAESIELEGATANDYEATLYVTDPTADITVTIPTSVTAAVMVSSLTTNAIGAANSVYGSSGSLMFEGSAADGYEMAITAANPTADVEVVLPNSSGTVMLSSLATNAPNAANSVTGASNALVFEGATANDYEISLSPADAGADVTITVPAVTGVMKLGIDTVLAKTANYTVLSTDSGSTIKVTGAYTMTLPAAAAGYNYCIVNYDGSDLVIDFADATDVALNEVNSPGDRVTNTTAYDLICLRAIDATNWVTVSSLGTWSDGN